MTFELDGVKGSILVSRLLKNKMILFDLIKRWIFLGCLPFQPARMFLYRNLRGFRKEGGAKEGYRLNGV